ncbi:MAG TPA: 2OG-Fe(II) oxygenase [Pyrinomonadaceae bacterium]|nr:2OG-Fe(II) oxygenase [Pyrinomonadaceae bacterium]
MSTTRTKLTSLEDRISVIDWARLCIELDERGYALTDQLLQPTECIELIQSYSNDKLFRSRVVMQRHNFGRGEYRYFADPLPSLVAQLRELFYAPLASIANSWAVRLRQETTFPPTLLEFIEVCAQAQQFKPTPLLLRYEKDDYNCLHQDIYGEIGFPLQAACVLNEVGKDYSGGEFLLSEQRPRAQTRAEAVTIHQGQFIIFPNRYRPVRGSRGDYRVNLRHGVSRLRAGMRYSLGIIFHNAR